ncbi:MAG: hypothetical protein AAGA12_09105 [Pseudomonadota bacterium]
MTVNQIDPKGLIREAFRIEGITDGECRSIFLDWALSLPEALATKTAIAELLSLYKDERPDHPMRVVLQDGLASAPTPRRRGGRRGRVDS